MTIEELIQKTKVFLLDMDGTIYIDETPIGEMKKTLSLLREKGKKLVYCTNNSSKTPEEYREKLAKIGFCILRERRRRNISKNTMREREFIFWAEKR